MLKVSGTTLREGEQALRFYFEGVSSVKCGLQRISMEDVSDSFTMQVFGEVKSIDETGRIANGLKELKRIVLQCKQNVEDAP